MGGDGEVVAALSAEIEQAGAGTGFSIVEFGTDALAVWQVSRDENGTPRPRRSVLQVAPSDDPAAFYAERLAPLLADARLLVVRGSPGEPMSGLFDMLRDARDAPAFRCRTPLEDLLRQAVRDSALTRSYDLVVLREEPAGRPDAGRLRMHSHPLFPPEAVRGHRRRVTVRCAPTDGHGTVFAVVTRDGRSFGPTPVTKQFAVLEPRDYQVTAVLTRPGQVKFEGLPVDPQPDPRSWPEIAGTVPDRLASPVPAHLICAVEVSGGKDRLERRIDLLQQLITCADGASRRLAVSLVAYGPHSVERGVPEEPAAVLAWATTSDRARSALPRLAGRRSPDGEYHRAAQLECALNEVAGRFSERDGRPVLVAIGGRPPHPPRAEVRTRIIPCPHRLDWQWPLKRLVNAPDIRFGALCDPDARGEIWRDLGRDALEAVDVVDVDSFAAALGLRDPVQAVPFPFIAEAGA